MWGVTRAASTAIRPPLAAYQALRHTPLPLKRTITLIPLSREQSVRIRRPWLTWSRIGLWTFYVSVSWLAATHLLNAFIENLADADDDDENDQDFVTRHIRHDAVAPGQEAGQHDNADADEELVLDLEGNRIASFLPLQAPKKLPRQTYRQWDPEWQEFVKLSRDTRRQAAIRQELAEKLAHTAATLKPFQQQLGESIAWTKLWLDFHYPDKSSPEYIRRGVTFLEQDTLWSRQIIPHSHYIQLQHILWPKALFTASSASLGTFYKLQLVRVKDVLGINLEQRERQLQSASRSLRLQPSEKFSAIGERNDMNDRSSTTKLTDSIFTADMGTALYVFMASLTQAWKASKLDTVPEGCCFLWGDVELKGSQGRCKMSVLAAYDPQNRTFVWVNSKPKRFWSDFREAGE